MTIESQSIRGQFTKGEILKFDASTSSTSPFHLVSLEETLYFSLYSLCLQHHMEQRCIRCVCNVVFDIPLTIMEQRRLFCIQLWSSFVYVYDLQHCICCALTRIEERLYHEKKTSYQTSSQYQLRSIPQGSFELIKAITRLQDTIWSFKRLEYKSHPSFKYVLADLQTHLLVRQLSLDLHHWVHFHQILQYIPESRFPRENDFAWNWKVHSSRSCNVKVFEIL